MKIFNFAILTIAFTINLSAQVHINAEGNEIESAILQVDASDKGVSLPNVALASTTDNSTVVAPKDGLLVYNINTAGDVLLGYYYWSAGAWHPIGKINNSYVFRQKLDLGVLGYIPSNTGITADNSTGNISGSSTGEGTNVQYVKLGCVKWVLSSGGNDHTYCAYNRQQRPFSFSAWSNDGDDWDSAFEFAKSRGGHLVTITSDTERNWLQTNIISAKNLTSEIWLGYNKYQSQYIPMEGNQGDGDFDTYRYKWITGEKWAVNWENTTGAVVQNNFASGFPARVNQNGCAYIAAGGSRQWRDRVCSETNASTNHIIVEFQDTY